MQEIGCFVSLVFCIQLWEFAEFPSLEDHLQNKLFTDRQLYRGPLCIHHVVIFSMIEKLGLSPETNPQKFRT